MNLNTNENLKICLRTVNLIKLSIRTTVDPLSSIVEIINNPSLPNPDGWLPSQNELSTKTTRSLFPVSNTMRSLFAFTLRN